MTESEPTISMGDLAAQVQAGERAPLARAITLVESTKSDHQQMAGELLQTLLPGTGNAIRIGITGVPGVGKSTVIDQFGINLTGNGHRVAVLAVDPSSTRTGGSILGDKTRMARLATDDNAFIRPSPTAGTLGGVARKTRETMLLCEAAGFDVILVETVGIGQSETTVSGMVDFFLALMLPGAGDELQGIKKGVVEIADMIAVNKADGDNVKRAKRAAAEYRAALHILTPAHPDWPPPVITISGQENLDLDTLWEKITEHRDIMTKNGALAERRRAQQVRWMWDMVEERLRRQLRDHEKLGVRLPEIEAAVAGGRMAATLAVQEIFSIFDA
jgi:GTPase